MMIIVLLIIITICTCIVAQVKCYRTSRWLQINMKIFFYKLWVRIFAVTGSIVIMTGTSILIVILFLLSLFNKGKQGNEKDPFHDSRCHPLNDPDAPRG